MWLRSTNPSEYWPIALFKLMFEFSDRSHDSFAAVVSISCGQKNISSLIQLDEYSLDEHIPVKLNKNKTQTEFESFY